MCQANALSSAAKAVAAHQATYKSFVAGRAADNARPIPTPLNAQPAWWAG